MAATSGCPAIGRRRVPDMAGFPIAGSAMATTGACRAAIGKSAVSIATTTGATGDELSRIGMGGKR